MVKIVDSNNNAQQNNTQTQDTAPLGGLGNETVKVQTAVPGTSTVSQFDNAFGIRNISTYAMHFTNLLDELKKSNEYLNAFRWGTIVGVGNEMGSAAYVAGQWQGHWLYGIIFFERGQSLRLKETTNNGQEDYYTITELFNKDVLAVVQKNIMEAHGLTNANFMIINSVPDLGKVLDAEWARTLMGQMMMGIFGRIAGYLGTLNLRKHDRYQASVMPLEDGAVVDANGHAQRADFAITVEHSPSNVSDATPTLLDTNQVQVYPRVSGTGFVNMRFTGQKPVVNGVYDLKQLQAEIVVSLVDSQTEGAMAPYERQLLLLAAFAEIAAIGGWRDLFVKRLNKQDRKFSRVAEYLSWGADARPDVSKIDGSREAIEGCLDMFAPREAALVVSHRAGNGLGGLSTMLSEIAVGYDNSLKQLLAILNSMSPRDQNGEVVAATSFTAVFASALKAQLGDAFNGTIHCSHIVKAAVPTVSGVYTGTAQKRSFQDMDLISVVTKLGDNANDVYSYLNAQSYSHRELNERQQRIYMLKLAASLFASKAPQATGESLDMAINPIFGKCLLDFVRNNCTWSMTGVNAYNTMATSLFFNNGGEDFTLSGNGLSASGSDFGLGVSLSNFKL
ncbi:hypothetical protein XI41_21145 [Salmonella enterica subsp. enterica serovar Derby]|nr:hypothetical protein [Salmonella enterica subsp. enterica serovar Derby]